MFLWPRQLVALLFLVSVSYISILSHFLKWLFPLIVCISIWYQMMLVSHSKTPYTTDTIKLVFFTVGLVKIGAQSTVFGLFFFTLSFFFPSIPMSLLLCISFALCYSKDEWAHGIIGLFLCWPFLVSSD